jgi:anti-sigma factor RsiW
VSAKEEQHLVNWLTKRLGATVRAPQLSTLGYKLMGGRLLPSGRTIAAQFMYEDASGQRLTLYIKKAGPRGNEETAFRFQEFQGVAVFYWLDPTCGYALVGAVPRDKLLSVARAVYDQIDR